MKILNEKQYIDYVVTKLMCYLTSSWLSKYIDKDGESIEDLQQDVIHFLLQQLHKYKPEKGMAYSYFGTIAKRYLINKNKKNYQKLQEKAEVEEIDNNHQIYNDIVNESNKIDLSKFVSLYVEYVNNNLTKLFPKINDQKTVDAILQLFKNRETLEIFNKKALYIYIREMADINTSQITKVIKKMKIIYKDLFNQYYENDYIDM